MAKFRLTVNGETVPPELIQAERTRLAALDGWHTITDPLEREALLQQGSEKSAIDRVLLRQEIEKDPRPVEEALLRAEMAKVADANGCRAEMTDNLKGAVELALKQQRLLRDLAGPVPRPRPQDLRDFYQANLPRFERVEQIHVSHVVKYVDAMRPAADALVAIQKALVELDEGCPFAEVADIYSDCKDPGGDLGWRPRGDLVEEFETVVFAMNVGQRSGIIPSRFGFHIAEVRDRRPAGIARFEDVADDVQKTLTSLLEQRAMEQAFDAVRARAVIERAAAEAA